LIICKRNIALNPCFKNAARNGIEVATRPGNRGNPGMSRNKNFVSEIRKMSGKETTNDYNKNVKEKPSAAKKIILASVTSKTAIFDRLRMSGKFKKSGRRMREFENRSLVASLENGCHQDSSTFLFFSLKILYKFVNRKFLSFSSAGSCALAQETTYSWHDTKRNQLKKYFLQIQ